ncbi:alpha/beta hydrolase [Nocardia flavorosea]|uniref:Alpha/beta hydrolase n=2 Tax=Nocardia flavorosea TaxID=53429 RepID=A0A846YTU3_9NOCA|nr:alpha/beta hydrolase [Nocardia flavorosea]NKY61061.1 alpha/beta hydrolase [Nocardia flavorosea]
MYAPRTRLNGIPCEEVVPTAGVDPGAGVLLYLPGGGFLAGGPGTHRPVADLALVSRAPVVVLAYRRLPETDIAGSVRDCLDAYRALTQRHPAGDITVIGDSAGGFLAFATTSTALRSEWDRPRALVGISPWLDLDCTAKAEAPTAATEAFLPPRVVEAVARWGCGGVIDPALSPLRTDDLAGFPPTLLLASDSEFLCPDAEFMAERLARAGVRHQLHLWHHRLHAFPVIAPRLPESKQAVETIAEFTAAAGSAVEDRVA